MDRNSTSNRHRVASIAHRMDAELTFTSLFTLHSVVLATWRNFISVTVKILNDLPKLCDHGNGKFPCRLLPSVLRWEHVEIG